MKTKEDYEKEEREESIPRLIYFLLSPIFFMIGFNYINEIYNILPMEPIGYFKSMLMMVVIITFRNLIFRKK